MKEKVREPILGGIYLIPAGDIGSHPELKAKFIKKEEDSHGLHPIYLIEPLTKHPSGKSWPQILGLRMENYFRVGFCDFEAYKLLKSPFKIKW